MDNPIHVIVAVDQMGGFAKDGIIPWHYPEDFAWFKRHTAGQACVMGSKTYEYINEKLGDKAKESVLPGRQCFVVSRTLAELPNATVVRNIRDAANQLPLGKPLFVLGGSSIYNAGVSLADRVYMTVINKNYDCTRFFPVDYVSKHFNTVDVEQIDTAPDLRFFIMDRKQ